MTTEARLHGVLSTYSNGHCRCVACRAVWAEYQRDRRARSYGPAYFRWYVEHQQRAPVAAGKDEDNAAR